MTINFNLPQQRMVKGLPPLTKEATLLVGLILAIFLIPSLPRGLLILLDNLLIRIALFLGLLSIASLSPMTAIVGFIVVAMLFIERNKYKVQQVKRSMEQSDETSPAIESIVTPETAPYQPPFRTPEVDSIDFFPQEDSGDNSFYPVAESQDHKQPLETEGSNDGSQKAINQLFSYIDPSAVQEA